MQPFDKKLLEKGIDLDNFSPGQIGEIEAALQQAIVELEREQNLINIDSIPSPIDTLQKQDISEIIVDNISVDSIPVDTIIPFKNVVVFGQHIFQNNGV